MKDKLIIGGVVLALVVGVVGIFLPQVSVPKLFGAPNSMLAENYIPYILYNGGFSTQKPVTIGASGSNVNQLQEGTCALLMASFTSLAASTTKTADCAVSGVQSGDTVFAQISTTTDASGQGWLITAAAASSTNGFITMSVSNMTGAAATMPVSIASSTHFLIFR